MKDSLYSNAIGLIHCNIGLLFMNCFICSTKLGVKDYFSCEFSSLELEDLTPNLRTSTKVVHIAAYGTIHCLLRV